jgi:hypothetical protein
MDEFSVPLSLLDLLWTLFGRLLCLFNRNFFFGQYDVDMGGLLANSIPTARILLRTGPPSIQTSLTKRFSILTLALPSREMAFDAADFIVFINVCAAAFGVKAKIFRAFS